MNVDKIYIEKYVKNGIEDYLISSSVGYKDIDNEVNFIILKVKSNIPQSYENALDVVFKYEKKIYRVILDKIFDKEFEKTPQFFK